MPAARRVTRQRRVVEEPPEVKHAVVDIKALHDTARTFGDRVVNRLEEAERKERAAAAAALKKHVRSTILTHAGQWFSVKDLAVSRTVLRQCPLVEYLLRGVADGGAVLATIDPEFKGVFLSRDRLAFAEESWNDGKDALSLKRATERENLRAAQQAAFSSDLVNSDGAPLHPSLQELLVVQSIRDVLEEYARRLAASTYEKLSRALEGKAAMAVGESTPIAILTQAERKEMSGAGVQDMAPLFASAYALLREHGIEIAPARHDFGRDRVLTFTFQPKRAEKRAKKRARKEVELPQ